MTDYLNMSLKDLFLHMETVLSIKGMLEPTEQNKRFIDWVNCFRPPAHYYDYSLVAEQYPEHADFHYITYSYINHVKQDDIRSLIKSISDDFFNGHYTILLRSYLRLNSVFEFLDDFY